MVKQTETVSEFYSPVGNGQFSPGLSEFSQNAGPGFEFPGTRHMKSDVGRQYRLLLMSQFCRGNNGTVSSSKISTKRGDYDRFDSKS